MGTRDIKKTLWEYQKAKQEYERLKRKIEEIETQLLSVGLDYTREKVKSSTNNQEDRLAAAIDKLTKLRELAINKAAKQCECMAKIYGRIEKVDDPLQRQILQMRYIEDLEWEEICYKIGYSWSHTHRIHKEALNSLGGVK